MKTRAELPGARRLAGFARTLRDNGFHVGLAETRDALSVLTSPAALKATSFKPALRALFCATHSDWRRFDEIFDAFWQGRHMRQRQVLSGAPPAGHAPARRLAESHVPQQALGLPDHVQRRNDESETPADGRGRREGASRVQALTSTDLVTLSIPKTSRRRMRSRRGSRASCARASCAATNRRRGRRLDLRRTIHRNVSHGGTLVDLAWRRRRSSRCGSSSCSTPQAQ